ncbi:hypothetical protein BFF78_42095 [Streptomyces fodineus]|uniref:Uncharacterized protein n=1 Tax=Streptomyces fodineus TaxID=1904616 RepID=A0A1D7YMD8_9ACTN|nr:hypothetical protein BFF78_42095 [Streptomyces fodineus]
MAVQPLPQVRKVVSFVGVQSLELGMVTVGFVSYVEMGDRRLQPEAVVGVGGGYSDAKGVGQDVHLGTRLPRSTGDGPASSPFFGADVSGVEYRPGQVDQALAGEHLKHLPVQPSQTPARDQIRNRRCTVDFDARNRAAEPARHSR